MTTTIFSADSSEYCAEIEVSSLAMLSQAYLAGEEEEENEDTSTASSAGHSLKSRTSYACRVEWGII